MPIRLYPLRLKDAVRQHWLNADLPDTVTVNFLELDNWFDQLFIVDTVCEDDDAYKAEQRTHESFTE